VQELIVLFKFPFQEQIPQVAAKVSLDVLKDSVDVLSDPTGLHLGKCAIANQLMGSSDELMKCVKCVNTWFDASLSKILPFDCLDEREWEVLWMEGHVGHEKSEARGEAGVFLVI